MKLKTILAALCATFLLAGCEETLDDQMTEYMEFYYPSTGDFWYDIAFDWGSYLITTHDKMDEEVHPDSEPFRGYVTLRPTVATPAEGLDPKLFLINPDGEVWTIERAVDIAKSTTREEVTVERVQGGTMTQTRTIQSESEPVILHFLANQGAWSRYGTMVADGDSYELERLETGG